MNPYIGHTHVVRTLRRELPPAALLRGPRAVGKWTLVHHLAEHHQVAAADRLFWPGTFDITAARAIMDFVATAPFGAFKLVAARLDGASEASLNALLKTLEEPPPTARFLLTAAAPVPATIVSRCGQFRMGLLSVDEVTTVLIAEGLTPAAARRAATLGRGQVDVARKVEAGEASRAAVLNVVRAIATGDRELFDRAFRSWDNGAHTLLVEWIRETVSGQWALFTEADTFGLSADQPRVRRMLLALSQAPNARTRIGVRAALEPFATKA